MMPSTRRRYWVLRRGACEGARPYRARHSPRDRRLTRGRRDLLGCPVCGGAARLRSAASSTVTGCRGCLSSNGAVTSPTGGRLECRPGATMNRVPPLTKQEWFAEVDAALTSVGMSWKIASGICEQASPMCYAEVTDKDGGAVCRVSLARDRFPDAAARREEVARQLRERCTTK